MDREQLTDWLRDLLAMERAHEAQLKTQSANAKLEPACRQQMAMHLAETRSHARAIEDCLRIFGAEAVPEAKPGGIPAPRREGFLGDDPRLHDFLAAYTHEHLEIAAYQSLRTAAEMLEEEDVMEMCDSILPDEERMAEWLAGNLPAIIRSYLSEEEMTMA